MLLKARLSGFYAETSQRMMTFSELNAAAYSSLLCPLTPCLLLLQQPPITQPEAPCWEELGVGVNKCSGFLGSIKRLLSFSSWTFSYSHYTRSYLSPQNWICWKHFFAPFTGIDWSKVEVSCRTYAGIQTHAFCPPTPGPAFCLIRLPDKTIRKKLHQFTAVQAFM